MAVLKKKDKSKRPPSAKQLAARAAFSRQKMRGTSKERHVKIMLEQAGYTCIRAASSMGLWDVHGVDATSHRLVQVKWTRLDGNNWKDKNCRLLIDLPVPPNTSKEVWVFRVGTGEPEIHFLNGKRKGTMMVLPKQVKTKKVA
jgi:hypothetical protein